MCLIVSEQGLTIKNRKAGLVQNLVTLRYLDSQTFLANIPLAIQKTLMNVVGPIGLITWILGDL